MLGLPKATELNKQLPKKAIYAKFQMNTAAKDRFDADISRISIVAEISPRTVGIAAGESIASIIEVKEESDIDSFLSGGQISFLTDTIKGLDDFELICFLVIR